MSMARRLRTKFIFKNVHPQNSNHLRSISKAITALDHSRLGLGNKFSGKQIGPIFFAFDKFCFTKSCQQIWGCVNQIFILFTYQIWGETVLFIIQTPDRMQYFTIFKDKLHSVNIQDDQSWLLTKPFKKFLKYKHLSSQPVLTSDKRKLCTASCSGVF